jgi:hypothetical protein
MAAVFVGLAIGIAIAAAFYLLAAIVIFCSQWCSNHGN